MRNMIALTALGIGLGTLFRFPAFALMMIASLVVFAVIRTGQSGGIGFMYDMLLGAIALQSGYFVTVLARIVFRRVLRRREPG